ncbi:MAG: sugar phosphorylase [Chloroflexi bacterium]|nr:sugar phosphorylase [Chloroflexota bacterium]
MKQFSEKLSEHLVFLYGEEDAPALTEQITQILKDFRAEHPDLAVPSVERRVSEKDIILITYGNMVQKEGQAPLKTLADFLQKYFGDVISSVHILPFYPYSSDDGFSVIDYRQVNPDLGTWDDIATLGKNFRLMFDAVVNHISVQSAEFQGFLKGDPKFQNFFIVVDPETDTSQVFRPRSSPLLTPFETTDGEKFVWTTFSADQVDLNYANPVVLIEVIKLLLFYVAHGAEFIRLDAVTYLWKDLSTNCINLPETHCIIQLIRLVLDFAAPNVALITETNVPHQDNIAYFGNGLNEAQMVYNFALSMLVLHTFHSGNAETLSNWASTLELPSCRATFFNFLAGHDGIGVTPVKDILSPEDIERAIERTRQLGGNIAYKNDGDGSQSPYELNINYLNALDDPENPATDPAIIADRFLAAQAIMLALRGVPGIYFHSLVGSQNWEEGVAQTGRYRTINRQKLQLDELEAELADPRSLRHHVYQGFHHLLDVRQGHPTFHPFGEQEILPIHPAVFSLLRTSPDGDEHLLCLQNISHESHEITLDLSPLPFNQADSVIDIISNKRFSIIDQKLQLCLAPYEVLWLGPK